MRRELLSAILFSAQLMPWFPVMADTADAVVLRVGEISLQASEVAYELSRTPKEKIRTEGISEEDVREQVLRLYKAKALTAEAQARELDKRADVVLALEAERRRILVDAWLKERNKLIEVPDLEVLARDYYVTHRDEFTKESLVEVSHILFRLKCDCVRCDCVAERQEKAEKAKAVLRSIRSGEPFSTLASQHSEDEDSRKVGGSLRAWFGRAQLEPEFAKVAFSLEVGGISDIVTTRFGYHIIRLDKKTEESTLTYEQVKKRILERLKKSYIRDQIERIDQVYLEQARQGEWNLDALNRFVRAPGGVGGPGGGAVISDEAIRKLQDHLAKQRDIKTLAPSSAGKGDDMESVAPKQE